MATARIIRKRDAGGYGARKSILAMALTTIVISADKIIESTQLQSMGSFSLSELLGLAFVNTSLLG